MGIQFDVFTINYTPRSPEKIFTVKDLSLDKNISPDTASKLKEVFQIIPLSMDINSYGRKLEVLDNSSLLDGDAEHENTIDNFIELVNENNDDKISSNCLFYIKEFDKVNYIIVVNAVDEGVCYEISIYTKSGILIQRYTDKLISNDIFTRSSNNVI